MMRTSDPYEAVRNISLLQRQAGVDSEIAELVTAYARNRTDAGREIVFYDEAATPLKVQPLLDRWLAKKNPDLDPRVMDFLIRYGRSMSSRKLPVIYSVSHLASKLRISEKQLKWMMANKGEFYKTFHIPKANGGSRTIQAPRGRMKTFQKWIAKAILSNRKPHSAAKGFLAGTSIVDNANPHAGMRIVVRLDLSDFFPSITFRQVRKVFQSFGYTYSVSTMLANICTLDAHLIQGSPASPALSNFAVAKIDRRFTGLRKKLGFRYTRYADDLTFSSDNDRLSSLVPFFKEVIREEGFQVNERKVRVMRRGQQQKVTGLVVNSRPNLTREHRRRLRAAMHRAKTQGIESVELASPRNKDSSPESVLKGHLAFYNMVNREQNSDGT